MSNYILFEIYNKNHFEKLRNCVEIFNGYITTEVPVHIEALKSELGDDFVKNFPTYTKKEDEDWQKRWFNTPVNIRKHDPGLKRRMSFESLVSGLLENDFQYLRVARDDEGIGRLEFDSASWPYGGLTQLKNLVRVFSHRIIGIDDGTGYTSLNLEHDKEI